MTLSKRLRNKMYSELCYIKSDDESVTADMNVHGTLILTVSDPHETSTITFKSSEIAKVETLISALQEWVERVKESA